MRATVRKVLSGAAFAAALAAIPVAATAEDTDDTWMGPGMMGGYGMGPGMMGGYGGGGCGMGPGMMGGFGSGALSMLDLTKDQRTAINRIFDDMRRRHWATMGAMLDQQSKLRDLNEAAEPDPKQVGAAYAEMSKLQRQMIESHVAADNEVRKLLTKEQREQYDRWRRGGGWSRGMRGTGGPRGAGRGPMGGPGAMGPGMMQP